MKGSEKSISQECLLKQKTCQAEHSYKVHCNLNFKTAQKFSLTLKFLDLRLTDILGRENESKSKDGIIVSGYCIDIQEEKQIEDRNVEEKGKYL